MIELFTVPISVLLFSPTDPEVPKNLKILVGGENTFTKSLLQNSPKEVKYMYFSEALKKGEIRYTHWQLFLPLLIKFRILPLDPGYHCIKLKKKFDLIHCHVYSLKIDGDIRPPVILSDSSSNSLFLKEYIGWSPLRIKVQYSLRKLVNISFGIYDREVNIRDSFRLVVFSEFAKTLHVNLGTNPDKITVVPPGLPDRINRSKKKKNTINILFAGVWFERKGGDILLSAYRKLKKKYPNISLTLLGPLPKHLMISQDENIIQHDFVSYKNLTNLYYPNADIFVLVPPRVEGYGMVVLESMSFGIPVIVSKVCALPELVEHEKTGFVVKPGSVTSLFLALERLVNSASLRNYMGRQARKQFIKHFQIQETNNHLLAVYKKAIAR